MRGLVSRLLDRGQFFEDQPGQVVHVRRGHEGEVVDSGESHALDSAAQGGPSEAVGAIVPGRLTAGAKQMHDRPGGTGTMLGQQGAKPPAPRLVVGGFGRGWFCWTPL